MPTVCRRARGSHLSDYSGVRAEKRRSRDRHRVEPVRALRASLGATEPKSQLLMPQATQLRESRPMTFEAAQSLGRKIRAMFEHRLYRGDAAWDPSPGTSLVVAAVAREFHPNWVPHGSRLPTSL